MSSSPTTSQDCQGEVDLCFAEKQRKIAVIVELQTENSDLNGRLESEMLKSAVSLTLVLWCPDFLVRYDLPYPPFPPHHHHPSHSIHIY